MGLPGIELLEEVCGVARGLEVPIILDAKRGDIGSTAEAYATAWLSGPHAGAALTVNPFLGFETLHPFVEAARRNGGAVFVLLNLCASIYFTHKMVGPTVAFRRHIAALKEGRYDAKIKLRRGDAFNEVASALNELSDVLHSKTEK